MPSALSLLFFKHNKTKVSSYSHTQKTQQYQRFHESQFFRAVNPNSVKSWLFTMPINLIIKIKGRCINDD